MVLLGLGSALRLPAQTLPDAGALLQQLPHVGGTVPPGANDSVPGPLPEAAPPPDGGLQVAVEQFAFSGNHLFSSAALQAVLAPYAQRRLSFSQLQEAAQALAAFYRQSGWVVRTYLPAQEISAGVVTPGFDTK